MVAYVTTIQSSNKVDLNYNMQQKGLQKGENPTTYSRQYKRFYVYFSITHQNIDTTPFN